MSSKKDHLQNLIAITKRLKLSPQYGASQRRSSAVARRKVSSISSLIDISESQDEALDEANYGEYRSPGKIDLKGMQLSETLEYVMKTKKEIQRQDQELAEQFLKIYKLIQQLKVRESCLLHQDLLDDVFSDTSDRKNLPDICDVPVNKRSSRVLQQCGVTRMNIYSKRFSCS